jgi:uncharacterized damage-inducible protein DinB
MLVDPQRNKGNAMDTVGLRNFLLAHLEFEVSITKKVISAIPETERDYKPDPKAKSAFELAWHIVSSEVWFVRSIAQASFLNDSVSRPAEVATISHIIAWYEQEITNALEMVRAAPIETLAKPTDFMGVSVMPAVNFLLWAATHTAHHRGQLSTYLRPMGGRVPSIYGGSADEPWRGGRE